MSKNFNIFHVAGLNKNEEVHTSIIAELIKPNKESDYHYNGETFLKMFIEMLSEIPDERLGESERIVLADFEPSHYETAQVLVEEPTTEGRRIDMVIIIGNYYIPFEVKIWAADQNGQLADYYKFTTEEYRDKRKMIVPCIFYLTPFGRELKKSDILKKDKVVQIYFKTDIVPWLQKCCEEIREVKEAAGVVNIIEQLCDNINRDFKSKDTVIDHLFKDLGECFEITVCTDKYLTFTLEKMEHIEIALRVHFEYGEKISFYLISGIKDSNGCIDYTYNTSKAYIDQESNCKEINDLIRNTFIDPESNMINNPLKKEYTWDWIAKSPSKKRELFIGDKDNSAFANECYEQIRSFLHNVLHENIIEKMKKIDMEYKNKTKNKS